jgi:hypothetical protein
LECIVIGGCECEACFAPTLEYVDDNLGLVGEAADEIRERPALDAKREHPRAGLKQAVQFESGNS